MCYVAAMSTVSLFQVWNKCWQIKILLFGNQKKKNKKNGDLYLWHYINMSKAVFKDFGCCVHFEIVAVSFPDTKNHNVLKMVFIARIGKEIITFWNIYKYTTILVIKVQNKLAKNKK